MLRPVPMLQFSAVVLEGSRRAVLKDWGRLGAVELLSRSPGLEPATLAPSDNSAQLARCDRLVSGAEELRQSLQIAASPQEDTEPEELTLDEAEHRLGALQERAGELLARRERLMQRWGELGALEAQVSSYCGLELPLDEPDRFEFLHFVTGSLPVEKLEELKVPDKVALLPLGKAEGRQRLVAFTTQAGRAGLERELARLGFERERLPAVAGATADSLSASTRREEEPVAAELKEVERRVRTLAGEAAQPLASLERRVKIERRLLEAEQQVQRTDAAVLLSGWVPASAAPALERRVRELTNNRCVIETAGPEQVPEEQVPVLLKHSRLVRPFEMLVAGYGLPTYRELEPTCFVALSFLLMFGMMFGDVGQGGLLAGAGLAGWLAGRNAKLRDAGLLLLFGGLSSMVFGLLYGSCFGLPWFKAYALWRDPLAGDPLRLLYIAMGIGVVLLSLGLVFNVLNHFRRGDVLGGFLDKFGVLGLVFYWGVLALIAHPAAAQSRGPVNWALLLLVGVPIAGWALKGPVEYAVGRRRGEPRPRTEGLWATSAESVVGAFEGVLSYLANTVSFVRLAAYALSHAALLVATFMLAAEVQRASAMASVLVIILGNLVAIVLEGVIASVQALRLEYYEFFGKFFSGAGRAFEPFRLPT